MTAAELIKALQRVPPKTQIRVYADHGQSCMKATTSGLQPILKTDRNNYWCDVVDMEGEGVAEKDVVYVFEIGAP